MVFIYPRDSTDELDLTQLVVFITVVTGYEH